MESKNIESYNPAIPAQIESWYTQWILVEGLYTEFAKRYDITSSAMFVLRTILEHPTGCTQRYICETLIYPKQTISSMIQTLTNKGIVRKRQSQEDKRNFELYLTEEGINFTLLMIKDLRKAEEKAFKAISPEDRKKFTHINEALTNALQAAMQIDIKSGD